MSMQADAGNPYVVAHIHSTDGHFTKQFSGKKTREKLGKMLPSAMQSDPAKWKNMVNDKKYTRRYSEGYVHYNNMVYAEEYKHDNRSIVHCAVLARYFNEKEKKYFLEIKYYWRDDSGQYTSKILHVAEDCGDRLYHRRG